MPSYKQNNFKESNVNYLNKDFVQLKQSLMDYAKAYFPNSYKDFNETSPGMMLMEMSAYVGDVLSFYIDQQYREMLLPLAEERRNVINLAKMFGYKVKPIVPAYVDLTVKSIVNSNHALGEPSTVDYSDAGVFDVGVKVTSNANTDLIFTTLEPIDFTVSQSIDTDVINTTNGDSGIAETYLLSRKIRAVSAEQKTKTFNIGAPTKFLKLTLPETNVIDIVSCVDSNGNNWYEVDFLAQDKVPIPVHYTELNNRSNAYRTLDDGVATNGEIAVPYSLSYITTNKRFTRETNSDNTTSLIFGNGILKNGTTIDGEFLDLEQAGIVVPGQPNDLNEAIDPLLGNEYSTLGETPIQTELTITYRVGGGVDSNAAVGDLTDVESVTAIGGNTAATIDSVNNLLPAVGGKNEEDVDEIREKTKAFFSTQNRCVTKEDYEARVLNVPSKYGNIAKAYVTRELTDDYNTINFTTTIDDLQSHLNALSTVISVQDDDAIEFRESDVQNIRNRVNQLPSGTTLLRAGAGEIRIYILSYDKDKNLVGNPAAGILGSTDNIPELLKNNIANYLDNFRILTDMVEIIDGFIINFGVFFNVTAHKYANKQEVKIRCINKIKDYFKIEKMQFGQPIYVSQLEYELMDVEGVRAVNYVTISQQSDWNAQAGSEDTLPEKTYKYSISNGGDFLFDSSGDAAVDDSGTNGYGWFYDFQGAFENGVILPVSPESPGVFELKNPNQNIKGVVK